MIALDHRSLTFRLTLLFGTVTTAVLILIGCVFYVSLESHFLHEDAIELRGKTALIHHLVARFRDAGSPDALGDRFQDALTGHDNLFLDIRKADGGALFSTVGAPFSFDKIGRSDGEGHDIDGMTMHSDASDGHLYRVTRFDVAANVRDADRLRVTLVMNVDHHREFMSRVSGTILLSVLLGALAAGLLGWAAVRVGIAPVRVLAALTSRISVNRLNDRVLVEHLPPELAELGQSFNAMLSRLEDSFRRLSDFSSDLAHELRTPVSVLMTQSQVALSRSRSIDDYREVIYSAMEEYDRLARMISDMLFLAKADHGLLVPAREPVDLRAEIVTLFDFYDALAEAKDVKLDVSGSGTVEGDPIMIRRAVSNLLSNAIRHTPSGSTVSVTIDRVDNAWARLAVTNPGLPISPEHLGRLFDRFYRVDSARQRATDGAGLGLAITQSIVVAHGGVISVKSESQGTQFEIRLPG